MQILPAWVWNILSCENYSVACYTPDDMLWQWMDWCQIPGLCATVYQPAVDYLIHMVWGLLGNIQGT